MSQSASAVAGALLVSLGMILALILLMGPAASMPMSAMMTAGGTHHVTDGMMEACHQMMGELSRHNP